MKAAWSQGPMVSLVPDAIGRSYGRYRLHHPEAERAMARSLERYGQIAPIVVCYREERPELLDGFKRVAAAPQVEGLATLLARVIEASETAAKAAIYGLNFVSSHTTELEEAWIVRALVREDGLSQVEVAELLGRHKSWVCRRLALLEKLIAEARDEIALGLLTPTAARHLIRLPAGNQRPLLQTIRAESLSTAEIAGVVDLLLQASDWPQERYVLEHPREALAQALAEPRVPHDPRLSPLGNEASKRLFMLLDLLSRFEHWLRHRARVELSDKDRLVLDPSLRRLGSSTKLVAELVGDLVDPRSLS